MSVCIAASAHGTPVTEAQKTQCLAVGIVYSQIAQEDAQLVQTLRDTTGQPTLDDLQTFRDLDALHEEAAEIGSILQDIYKNAARPAQSDLTALRNSSQNTLLSMAEACVPAGF